jgi:hypothetical protein
MCNAFSAATERMRMRPPFAALALGMALGACAPDPAHRQQEAVDALLTFVPQAQEEYRRQHGRYADHARMLLAGADTLANGIRISLDADSLGWNASDPRLVGPACVTFRGAPASRRFLRGVLRPLRPGEVMCIEFAHWERENAIRPALYDSTGKFLGALRHRPADNERS